MRCFTSSSSAAIKRKIKLHVEMAPPVVPPFRLQQKCHNSCHCGEEKMTQPVRKWDKGVEKLTKY